MMELEKEKTKKEKKENTYLWDPIFYDGHKLKFPDQNQGFVYVIAKSFLKTFRILSYICIFGPVVLLFI